MKEIRDDDYDFGFSLVDENELKQIERDLQRKIEEGEKKLKHTSDNYQQKLESLYGAIMPFLQNLCKNPEKSYLYWPNRKEKIQEFINTINKITDK